MFSGEHLATNEPDWPVFGSPSSRLCWASHSTDTVVNFVAHSKSWLLQICSIFLAFLRRYVTACTTIVSGVSYAIQMEGFRVLIKKEPKSHQAKSTWKYVFCYKICTVPARFFVLLSVNFVWCKASTLFFYNQLYHLLNICDPIFSAKRFARTVCPSLEAISAGVTPSLFRIDGSAPAL